MEYKSIKKYGNSPLLTHFHKTLPMEEFLEGNFSQVHNITVLYQQLIKNCIEECKKDYTGREDGNREIYIDEKRKKLEEEKYIVFQQYQNAQNELELANKKKDNDITGIKNAFTDKDRQIFCTIIHKTTNISDIVRIQENAQNAIRKTRINDHMEMIKSVIEQNIIIDQIAWKRNNYKRKLDHKSNTNSIQAQLNDLSNGVEIDHLIKHIKSSIKHIFTGDRYEQTEICNTKEYFIEVFTMELCKYNNIPNNIRKKIIQNHTDKVGIFDYIYSLYTRGHIALQEIDSMSLETSIKVVTDTLHHYNSMLTNHYGSTKIQEKDIIYVEKILQAAKHAPWGYISNSDERLQKLFHLIIQLDIEQHYGDFEEKVASIRNADYYGYYTNISLLHSMLLDIFSTMTPEEQEEIYKSYQHNSKFQKIQEEYKKNKKEGETKQLLLFGHSTDEMKDIRIRALQELIHTYDTIPKTLGDEEYNALETIIFAKDTTKIPLRYKKDTFAKSNNRKKSAETKQVVRGAFLKELLEQELMGRNSFPRAIRILQPHIIFKRESLYKNFPIQQA